MNSCQIPNIINGEIVLIATLIEKAYIAYDLVLNASGLQSKVKEAVDKGEFADEVQQLSIKLQEYFAAGPKWRLIGKLINKTSAFYAKNVMPITVPNMNAKNVFQKNQDL